MKLSKLESEAKKLKERYGDLEVVMHVQIPLSTESFYSTVETLKNRDMDELDNPFNKVIVIGWQC